MFALNSVFGKDTMSREVGFATFTEFTFVRMIFMSLASYACLFKLKMKVTDVPSNLRIILLARCCIGSVNFIILAIALKTLPLTISTIIISTNPFFTALLQYFWINQLITVYDAVSMVGSFLGIVLIGISAPQKPTSQTTAESDSYLLGIICSITAAVFLSFIYVATSRMRSIHYLIVSFYLGVVCGILCTFLMIFQYIIDGRVPF